MRTYLSLLFLMILDLASSRKDRTSPMVDKECYFFPINMPVIIYSSLKNHSNI